MKPFDSIVTGPHPEIAQWIAQRTQTPFFSDIKYNTLAWLDSRGLKCAVMYNCYSGYDIHMHIAARPGSLWCHPLVLKDMFAYPFVQLGVRRITAPITVQNKRCRDTVESAGLVLEGICKELGADGSDICIYRMLKRECRWIGEANGRS